MKPRITAPNFTKAGIFSGLKSGEYAVSEIFESINGEGQKAGRLAVFVRFAGCNLNCTYCDTGYAIQSSQFKVYSADEIYSYIKSTGINLVTVTGGEPLIQPNIKDFLRVLADDRSLEVEIETNGAVDISEIVTMLNRPSLTMDYKLPSGGMEQYMLTDNFQFLNKSDTVKFVAGTKGDLERLARIINEYDLLNQCAVYISPVFGKLEPSEIVDFMKERNLCGVTLQLQLHKYIWGPDSRGV